MVAICCSPSSFSCPELSWRMSRGDSMTKPPISDVAPSALNSDSVSWDNSPRSLSCHLGQGSKHIRGPLLHKYRSFFMFCFQPTHLPMLTALKTASNLRQAHFRTSLTPLLSNKLKPKIWTIRLSRKNYHIIRIFFGRYYSQFRFCQAHL